jgi:hypothetical protein
MYRWKVLKGLKGVNGIPNTPSQSPQLPVARLCTWYLQGTSRSARSSGGSSRYRHIFYRWVENMHGWRYTCANKQSCALSSDRNVSEKSLQTRGSREVFARIPSRTASASAPESAQRHTRVPPATPGGQPLPCCRSALTAALPAAPACPSWRTPVAPAAPPLALA